jgi:hypothetical protein
MQRNFKVRVEIENGEDCRGREYTFGLLLPEEAKVNASLLLDQLEKVIEKHFDDTYGGIVPIEPQRPKGRLVRVGRMLEVLPRG